MRRPARRDRWLPEPADRGRGRIAEPGSPHIGRSSGAERRDVALGPGDRRRPSRQPVRGERRRERPPHRRVWPSESVPLRNQAGHQRPLDRRRGLERLGRDQQDCRPDGIPLRNFGWPCYEGAGRQSGYDGTNLDMCENLYSESGSVTSPLFTYAHSQSVVADDGCSTGGSAISGMAFYGNGNYPAAYQGALFFADYTRRCMWVMFPGSGGEPDPANRAAFASAAAGPVDLRSGRAATSSTWTSTGGPCAAFATGLWLPSRRARR